LDKNPRWQPSANKIFKNEKNIFFINLASGKEQKLLKKKGKKRKKNSYRCSEQGWNSLPSGWSQTREY